MMSMQRCCLSTGRGIFAAASSCSSLQIPLSRAYSAAAAFSVPSLRQDRHRQIPQGPRRPLGGICTSPHRASYHSKTGVYGFKAKVHASRNSSVLQQQVPKDRLEARANQSNLFRLAEAFRKHGHKYARTNPFRAESMAPACGHGSSPFDPSEFGLDPAGTYATSGVLFCPVGQEQEARLDEVLQYLDKVYCGTVAVDLSAVETEAEHEWLCERYEALMVGEEVSRDDRVQLATEMLKSQNFDVFLATKFSNVKRYGGEGAEAMMGFFTELFRSASKHGVEEIMLGMPHRGRLNLLTGMLRFPPVAMFRKMKGLPEFPPDQRGAGDVLSHLTSSVDLEGLGPEGGPLHVTMLPNPSHLEAVNPVTVGKARGRHFTRDLGDYTRDSESPALVGDSILAVQVHGDAAIAGQGVNQELLNMARLPHFTVGGSLHLIVDNQVGFTTPGDRGRSSIYSSDCARMIGAPVIHVNGDDPEGILKATRLAMEYRSRFCRDAFVEIHCVRRWGHNELDDPTFTNPILYQYVAQRKSVPDSYADRLVEEGLWTREDVSKVLSSHSDLLNKDYARIESYKPQRENLKGQWRGMEPAAPDHTTCWDTGLTPDVLRYVGSKSVAFPDGFATHPHLLKHHVDARLKRLQAGEGLDWGMCEALAIGSLLYQGFNVRISGQDVGRATFSHRHAMLVDQATNEMYIPFNDLCGPESSASGGRLEVVNSLLSEEAVMGFEYGVSIDSPKNLVIWEAQFGDFFNGAQIMLDTFLSSGESKWGLQSAMTILLPHGMDGAGPEHSSCRMERFLQMTDSREDGSPDGDDVNWQVVYPTTAGQYFHLLRRQMLRNYRKPLVVVAPKTMLRMSAASSTVADMGPGTSFKPVLGDPNVVADPAAVTKVVFVTGKHYYALTKLAQEKGIKDQVALIRLEQLCPFPAGEIHEELAKYPNASKFVWSQEEHRNSGAWSFVEPRFRNLLGLHLTYVGRSVLCQPAVGVSSVHKAEEQQVLEDTLSL